jgi:phage host-nuclease inhibitor protein Gam
MIELSDVLYPKTKEPFSVTDYGSANWTASKAMEATTEIVRLQAQATEWHAKIDSWLEDATRQYEGTVEKMKLFLAPFIEGELKESTKRSLVLPSARVGFRKAPAHMEVDDEAAAIAWAKEHVPDAVKVKESILKKPLIAKLEETGELADGARWVEGTDTFYIEPVG